MNHIRRGSGKPLLLLHGLGQSWKSWEPVLPGLAAEREVIAIDLPGFGKTPPLSGIQTINALADAVTEFIRAQELIGVDTAGISMGGRLVLELARRGEIIGTGIALAPACYWTPKKRGILTKAGKAAQIQIKALKPILPLLVETKLGRKAFLSQISAHPEKISPHLALDEMESYTNSPSTGIYLNELMYGEDQPGAPFHSIKTPLVVGWGRRDNVCFPEQAPWVLQNFPDAKLHWFEDSGHLSIWDKPQEVVELILKTTGKTER